MESVDLRQHWQGMRELGYAAAIGTTFPVAYLWLRLISTTSFTMQARSNCQEYLPRVHALGSRARIRHQIKRSKRSLGKVLFEPFVWLRSDPPRWRWRGGSNVSTTHGFTNKETP
jgi:hypothetical protein